MQIDISDITAEPWSQHSTVTPEHSASVHSTSVHGHNVEPQLQHQT